MHWESRTLINNRQNNNRRRNRTGPRPQGGGGSNRPEQGNRIDNRARGNAPQLLEKYKNLARDAQMQGDRVMTEYYLQFADHYFRVLADNRTRFEEQQAQRRQHYDMPGDAEVEGVAMGDEGEPIQLSLGHQQPRQSGASQDADDNESGADSMADDEFGGDRGREQRMRDRRPRRDDRDGGEARAPRRDERDVNEARAPRRDDRDFSEARAPRRDDRDVGEARAPRRDDRDAGEARAPRGRRPITAEDAPAQIDMAVLPPAINQSAEPASAGSDEEAAAPRRRGRPRRIVAASEA